MRERIPDDIWRQIRPLLGAEEAHWALPTSRTRAGTSGETWIVASDTRLVVADRPFGGALTILETPIRLIQRATLGDGVLELGAGHDVFDRISFGALERADVERLAGVLRAPSAAAPLQRVPSPRSPGIFVLPMKTSWSPGDTVEGLLRVVWPAEGPVARVGLRFYGAEHASAGSERDGMGDDARTVTFEEESVWADQQDFPILALAGRTMPLAAGVHDFPFRFSIPPDAPPTFHGANVSVAWTISARLESPGLSDRADRVEVPVRHPRRELSRPASSRSVERDGLSVEVRAEAATLVPGGFLDAAVVVRGKPDPRAPHVHLDLQRLTTTRAQGRALVDEERMAQARVSNWADGTRVPVRIPLPPDFVAPVSGRLFDVSHRIVAHIPFRSLRIEIPLSL